MQHSKRTFENYLVISFWKTPQTFLMERRCISVMVVTRIFFATDVHGSEHFWRKWISAASIHKANILMLCGDLTGKAIAR